MMTMKAIVTVIVASTLANCASPEPPYVSDVTHPGHYISESKRELMARGEPSWPTGQSGPHLNTIDKP